MIAVTVHVLRDEISHFISNRKFLSENDMER